MTSGTGQSSWLVISTCLPMRGGGLGLPDRTRHKEFGAVAAAWGMLEDLGAAAIIDEVAGGRRGPKTPGAGPAGSGEEVRAAGTGRGDRRGAAGQRAVGAAVAASLAGCPARPGWRPAGRRRGAGWMRAAGGAGCGAGCRTTGGRVGDQRWTLARVRDLVAAKFKVQYTIPGIWYLLRRRGWTGQIGRAPRDRARRRRGGGAEEGNLAADKSTAAALGGWIIFEDECGQSMRPPGRRPGGGAGSPR